MATDVVCRFQGRFSTGNNRLLTTGASAVANPKQFLVQGNVSFQTRDVVFMQVSFDASEFTQFTLPDNADVAFGGPHCFLGFTYKGVKFYIATDNATMCYDSGDSEYVLYICGVCVPYYLQ